MSSTGKGSCLWALIVVLGIGGILGVAYSPGAFAQRGMLDDPPDTKPKRGLLDDVPDTKRGQSKPVEKPAVGRDEKPASREEKPANRDEKPRRVEEAKPKREEVPGEKMTIPTSLADLKGCWQSETGDIPVVDPKTDVRIGS